MSVRGVGEVHVSGIGFRCGVLGTDDEVGFDEPGNDLVTGCTSAAQISREFLHDARAERDDADLALAHHQPAPRSVQRCRPGRGAGVQHPGPLDPGKQRAIT